MDIQPTTQQQPISDDQELAKALAGVTSQADADLQYEDTPIVPQQPMNTPTDSDSSASPMPAPDNIEQPVPEIPAVEPMPTPTSMPTQAPIPSNLEQIKKDALVELRPLVDKLNISPEEKFDTYLLLIRSTDDTSLIAPAHAAAAAIVDEARRAQALLDIIKEIDYLSSDSKTQASV